MLLPRDGWWKTVVELEYVYCENNVAHKKQTSLVIALSKA